MYRPKGLTKAELLELYDSLRDPHSYYATAEVHDYDDKVHSLPAILDGQVDGKRTGRSLNVTFMDPSRSMHDVEGINAAHYIIRVTYWVLLPSRGSYVDIPVFTGPIDTCIRDDMIVTVTARGKGALLQRQAGNAFTIPKGISKTEAVIRIAVQGGELRAHMNIPERPPKLTADYLVGSLTQFWVKMVTLSDSLHRMLYYDPAGILVMKPKPTTDSFTFRANVPGGFLTKAPAVAADFVGYHNEIWYHYKDKGTPPVIVQAPPAHPLSKESRAWHGQPYRLIKRDPPDGGVHLHVDKTAEATRNAQTELDQELLHVVHVTAECFPFPFIEPLDLYRFESTDYTDVTTVDWTLPLLPGNAMTLGWNDFRNRG